MRTFKSGYTYNSTKTLSISPELKAYSYNWYCLGKKVNDSTYIVNNYSYSTTTMKHRSQLIDFIRNKAPQLKIVFFEAPKGLQDLDAALELHANELKQIETDLMNKRKRETTKQRLRLELKEQIETIAFINQLKNSENK